MVGLGAGSLFGATPKFSPLINGSSTTRKHGSNQPEPPQFWGTQSALDELRLRLMERIEFWKAEGRRYVTDQKAFQRPKWKQSTPGGYGFSR
jgi:hypothetical protein